MKPASKHVNKPPNYIPQGQAVQFITAGYDTVASTLSFTLFLMTVHEDKLSLAMQEVDELLGGEFPNYDTVQKLTYIDMCVQVSQIWAQSWSGWPKMGHIRIFWVVVHFDSYIYIYILFNFLYLS